MISKGSNCDIVVGRRTAAKEKVKKNVGLEHYNRFSNDDGNIVVGKKVCANKYLVMYILDFVIEDPISIYSVQLSCCELRSWKHSKLSIKITLGFQLSGKDYGKDETDMVLFEAIGWEAL